MSFRGKTFATNDDRVKAITERLNRKYPIKVFGVLRYDARWDPMAVNAAFFWTNPWHPSKNEWLEHVCGNLTELGGEW